MEKLYEYFISLFENDADEEKYKLEEESPKDKYLNDIYLLNNNDALNFINSFLFYLKFFIHSITDFFLSNLKNYKNNSNLNIIIFYITILSFGLVFSFNENYENSNSNVSTNLIISAYFNKKKVIRITYEEYIKNENNETNYNYDSNNLINNVSINNDIIGEQNLEYFSFKKILISIICFFVFSFVIKLTINLKIKNSTFFNLIGIFISYNFANKLYRNKNYFASNSIFGLLLYFIKNLLDSLYLKLNFQRKDFEIFTKNFISYSFLQFFLKFISLLNITFFSFYISVFHFNFFFNYFYFYLCSLSVLTFIGNNIEQKTPLHLKPFKNIFIFIIGALNLVVTKIFLKKFFFKEKNDTKFSSLYFMNDLYSTCFLSFINTFIETQNKLVIILHNEGNKIININNKSYYIDCKNIKYYLIDKNFFWIILFFISISLGYLGIYIQEYFLFLISIYTTKKFINYFSQIYNLKLSRILNNIFTFNFFSFFPFLIKLDDFYLLNMLKKFTNFDIDILSFSLKFIFLLLLLYYIITTNFFLYICCDRLKNKEYKSNNNSKIFNIIYVIIEIFVQFFIIYIIIIIYKYYEKNVIINILNIVAIIIYHLLKIPLINELKEKNCESMNYNFYIFIWIIISLRFIEISGPQISLLYLINHINLIFFINFYILNDKNNNIFKIIVILILLIDYCRIKSWLFIVDAIAIIIYPIIKNFEIKNEKKYYYGDNKINAENIRAYNKLTFFFALFLLLFSVIEII